MQEEKMNYFFSPYQKYFMMLSYERLVGNYATKYKREEVLQSCIIQLTNENIYYFSGYCGILEFVSFVKFLVCCNFSSF